MRTNFRAEQLTDPHMRLAEKALRTCVHCGFCTATCPTYLVLGDERDGPRGRIMLMQHMLESPAPPTAETVTHLDRCLSCLGCRTTCPSGTDYAALIDQSRAHIERYYKRDLSDRLFRSLILFVLTRPNLFRLASRLAHRFASVLSHLPGRLGAMSRKAQPVSRRRTDYAVPETSAAARRVLLLPGCVQRALAPEIDDAATRVLARQDLRVERLDRSGCCGALAFHMGKTGIGRSQAQDIIRAFETATSRGAAEAVLMTATGCSGFLKDYPNLFAGEPEWQARAEVFAQKAKDFSELAKPAEPPGAMAELAPAIAYHPPCSLQHGQRLQGRGEALLAAAGFRLVPIPDSHLCCGSAGSYSLLQPDIAARLRANKLDAIRSTGAAIIASANVGCLSHLSGELPALHIAQLLDWAEGGPRPESLDSALSAGDDAAQN
jgi:glycolate oxidase iron-sulfur subunit